MKKLTKRDEYGNADIIGVETVELQCDLEYEQLNKVTKALNKLADYEETGLEPDDINALAKSQIETAKRNIEYMVDLDWYKTALCEAEGAIEHLREELKNEQQR